MNAVSTVCLAAVRHSAFFSHISDRQLFILPEGEIHLPLRKALYMHDEFCTTIIIIINVIIVIINLLSVSKAEILTFWG